MAQSKRPRRRRKTDPSAQPSRDTKRWEFWNSRVTRAREIRDKWESKFMVERLGKFFLGEQAPDGDPETRVFNRFQSTVKTISPNLMFQQPKFYVRPKPGQERVHERSGAIAEGVLDAIGSQDDHLAKVGDLAVQQAFFRMGVLKVCYEPTEAPNDLKGEAIFDKDGQPMVNPMTGEAIVEPDTVVTDEVYRYKWVDGRNMLLPDEGPDMTDWTWIGEEVTVPLEDAKQDERFPKARRDALKANVSYREEPSTRRRREHEAEMFKYVEVYDFKEHRRLIWAEGQDERDFLVDDDTPEGIEDHPYSLLGYTPIIEPEPNPWPLPPTFSWLPLQEEYNIRRRQITEGAKRSARKVYYEEGTFPDPDEAQAGLQSPADMEAVKVTDLSKPPITDTPPSIGADIYRDIELLNFDWMTVTGQTGARMGTQEGETATESMFVERSANLRDSEMKKAIYQWLATAGRKMLQLVRQTMTVNLWVKMRGYDDTEFTLWVQNTYGTQAAMAVSQLPNVKQMFMEQYGTQRPMQVSKEELAFEADVSVAPGSQRPQTLEAERRTVMEFLTVLAGAPMLGMSRGLLGWIGEKFDPPVPGPVLDELHALSKAMVQIQANQAGRNQGPNSGTQNGGGPNGNAGGAADPTLGMNALMQTAANGGM